MNIYTINFEKSSKDVNIIAVFANEKLAKQYAKKYIEEKSLDVKKKRFNSDNIRKVLYFENVKENPFAITIIKVQINIETIKEKQQQICKTFNETAVSEIEQQIQPMQTIEQEIEQEIKQEENELKKVKKPSAYMIFTKENRERIKKEYTIKNNEKPTSKELMKLIRNEWLESDEESSKQIVKKQQSKKKSKKSTLDSDSE